MAKKNSQHSVTILNEKPEEVGKPVPYKCHINDDLDGNTPDFIYGGPFFVPLKKEDRLMDLNTPRNVAHSGSYKRYSGPQVELYKCAKLFVQNCILRR